MISPDEKEVSKMAYRNTHVGHRRAIFMDRIKFERVGHGAVSTKAAAGEEAIPACVAGYIGKSLAEVAGEDLPVIIFGDGTICRATSFVVHDGIITGMAYSGTNPFQSKSIEGVAIGPTGKITWSVGD